MITKKITYYDLDGNEVTEEFMFHLNMAEVTELEVSHESGMHDALSNALSANDRKFMCDFIKDLILRSFGEKSPDKKSFVKDPKKTADFACSEAYASLFIELIGDDSAIDAFIRGVFPAQLVSRLDDNERAKATQG